MIIKKKEMTFFGFLIFHTVHPTKWVVFPIIFIFFFFFGPKCFTPGTCGNFGGTHPPHKLKLVWWSVQIHEYLLLGFSVSFFLFFFPFSLYAAHLSFTCHKSCSIVNVEGIFSTIPIHCFRYVASLFSLFLSPCFCVLSQFLSFSNELSFHNPHPFLQAFISSYLWEKKNNIIF